MTIQVPRLMCRPAGRQAAPAAHHTPTHPPSPAGAALHSCVHAVRLRVLLLRHLAAGNELADFGLHSSDALGRGGIAHQVLRCVSVAHTTLGYPAQPPRPPAVLTPVGMRLSSKPMPYDWRKQRRPPLGPVASQATQAPSACCQAEGAASHTDLKYSCQEDSSCLRCHELQKRCRCCRRPLHGCMPTNSFTRNGPVMSHQLTPWKASAPGSWHQHQCLQHTQHAQHTTPRHAPCLHTQPLQKHMQGNGGVCNAGQ